MELKLCAFCGEEAHFEQKSDNGEWWLYHFPEDHICPAEGIHKYASIRGLLESWNTRASETPNRERIIELVEELSDLVGGV